VEVPYIPGEGDQVIKVWVAVPSPGNRVVYRIRPVKYLDITPPAFEIVAPQNGAIVPPGAPLTVQGWAEDRQSGVAVAEWSLDGGPWQPVTVDPGGLLGGAGS
jgi:hypothetical protein